MMQGETLHYNLSSDAEITFNISFLHGHSCYFSKVNWECDNRCLLYYLFSQSFHILKDVLWLTYFSDCLLFHLRISLWD